MTSTHERLRRLSAIQGLAGKLEATAPGVVKMMLEGQRGHPSAQNWETDRTAGHATVLDDDGTPMPSVVDPTGETAVTDGPDGGKALEELDRAISEALRAVTRAADVASHWRPATQPELPLGDGPGELWCRSCWRDDQYCEPVSENYKGRGECRWCGDFFGQFREMPPLPVLRKRHVGERIDQAFIDKHLRRAS